MSSATACAAGKKSSSLVLTPVTDPPTGIHHQGKFVWNDLLLALTLLDRDPQPLTVGLATMVREEVRQVSRWLEPC